jgi:hypothetical protein
MAYCHYCDEHLDDSELVAAPGRSAAGGAKPRDRCPTCGRKVDVTTATAGARSGPTADNGSAGEVAAVGPGGPSTEAGETPDEQDGNEPADEEVVRPKAPWHFKVLVVGTAVYMGWRLYQGIGWLVHHA